MAKSRVSPLKAITIPRLELQAAVLATRIAKIITSEHEFKIINRVFWSDSAIVLHWIKNGPHQFKSFVANRLSEIRENSKASEWKWVPSKENPADDGTRYSPESLNNDSHWFLGPPFLYNQDSQWTEVAPKIKAVDEISLNSEILKSVICVNEESPFIDFTRFSTLERLLSVVSRMWEAINRMRKINVTQSETRLKAKELCLRISQVISFNNEINALKNGKGISKNSRIYNLNPFLDDQGLLRAEGRLSKFCKDDFSSHPIILDSKENLSRLLIKSYHNKFFHSSHESVINELRQKFWILGLRTCLRILVNRCSVCKILRGKPNNPKMAALPSCRLAYRLRPFTHTGLDYFGPMQVKIGRRHEKRYGALFTCMTSRAIHIELAHSLSTDSAIMALKRSMARKGVPLVVYCDNGTNFRGMSKELQLAVKEIDPKRISKFASQKEIKWKFNPPSAPHMGGAWERLVRSVKIALNVVLKTQAPREEVLLTALMEIEHCVNSRPLSHVSVDPRDQEALTPNHFLLGASSGEIRFGRCDIHSNVSQKQWRIAQNYADHFWRRWLREYLPTLIPRKKWIEKDLPLKVGDVVLILDENLERNQWRKGIVTQIFPGSEDEVRIVEVRTAIGNLLRPARKLVRFAEVQNAEVLYEGENVTDR